MCVPLSAAQCFLATVRTGHSDPLPGFNCLTKSSRLPLLVLAICHVVYNKPECILFCFLSNVLFLPLFNCVGSAMTKDTEYVPRFP